MWMMLYKSFDKTTTWVETETADFCRFQLYTCTLLKITWNCLSTVIFTQQILLLMLPGRTKRSSVEPSSSLVG